MLGSIALLLVCQLIGEIINRLTGLPLPGAVIGMVLLLGWLAIRPAERPALQAVSGWLIAHLSLLFVPAAVGIMNEGAAFTRHGLAIGLAALASTLLTLVVTMAVFNWAAKRGAGG